MGNNIQPTTNSSDLPTAYQNENTSDEIDLKDIIRQLWIKRKFILIITGLAFLLGILIAMTSPVKYTAGCTVVTQTGQKSSGNLGGLAALAGINAGASFSGETLSPTVYSEIIKSVPFTREIMQTRITPNAANGQPITVYEFYTDKKYNKPGFTGILKKYTIGLPGTILSSLRGKTDETIATPTDSLESVQILSKDEKKAYDAIQANMSLELNNKDGYVKLGYTFPQAEGAAQIADKIRKTLEQFVIAYKLDKVADDLAFVEKNYAEARRDFLQKQANLASFQDANRGLVSALARTTERRLSNDYDLAFTVYNELAKQREQAQLAVTENKPVLTVINPVIVPTEKSAPKRSMIMAVFLMLGLIVSIGWVLIKPFFKDIAESVKK